MAELTRPVKQGQWSESALRVLQERYLNRSRGQISETPEEMCWRVAGAIAAAEVTWGKTEEQVHEVASRFYDLIVDSYFLPNSPTLMRGRTMASSIRPASSSRSGIPWTRSSRR